MTPSNIARNVVSKATSILNIIIHPFKKDLGSIRIKRKIPLNKIKAVTVSKLSDEFVIHVSNHYDIRYSSKSM